MSLSGGSGSSAEMKNQIMTQLQSESAMNNARTLVQKLNENCFEKCISTPQSSLSSRDESCLSMCVQKYVATWNLTSRAYISRIGREREKNGLPTGGDLGALGGGGNGI